MSETPILTRLRDAWQKFGRKPYNYKPLSNEHAIRLIRFIDVDTLECELIEVESIEVAPKYVALSYTWGDTTDPVNIVIDGQLLSVTRNLNDALRHLARRCVHDEALFWADAICINQADRDERATQVLLMKDLYERAFRVDVWLGVAADDSDLAMDTMAEFNLEMDKRVKSLQSGEFLAAVTTLTPDDEIFDRPSRSQFLKAFKAIRQLLYRPWWYRAWILQESTGPAKTDFICGTRRAPLSSFTLVSDTIDQISQYREFEALRRLKADTTNILFILQVARTRSLETSVLRFLELLQIVRSFSCTDPRDRVYAILALASNVQRGDLVPDYHLEIKPISLEVAKLVLQKYPDGHRLDFLGYVFRSAKDSKLLKAFDDDFPSWLPDWRTRIAWGVLPNMREVSDTGPATRLYHASGDTVPSVAIDGDMMSVLGFCIDTVTSVTNVFITEESSVFHQLKLESRLYSTDAYPTGGNKRDSFMHTAVADLRSTSTSTGKRGFALDFCLLESDVASLNSEELHEQDIMLRTIENIPAGRRLCWTKQGFLALVPAAVQPGDSICCFYGGQVLYCLRARDESTYEFLGECYVHGLMDGEAFKYRQSEEMFKLT